MVKHLVPKVFLIGSLFTFAVACAPRQELSPYSNLIDQGLLPVSTTNPYLGANLFLSGEAQRSGYLLNFLKGRGGPVAIELESSNFGGTTLLMYYPKDREVYQADLQPIHRGNVVMTEWLVRGPYAIERRDYRELNRLDGSLVGEPVFIIRGKPTKFSQQIALAQENEKRRDIDVGAGNRLSAASAGEPVIVPVVPTPKPKKKEIIRKAKEHLEAAGEVAPKPTEPARPLNSDQQALRLAQGLIELSPSGDGVHIVISEKQTLKALAAWYTGDEKNASAIAEASGLEAGKEPSLASRVMIPKRMLKNEKRMTE